MLSNLHDRDLLAQIEAVDAFMDRMHAYPGRTFGQLYHRFFRTNDLADGRLELERRHASTSPTCSVPVLAVAGARRRDRAGRGLPPRRGDLLPNAPRCELETAPGGHLGVLTGRAARRDDVGAARRASSTAECRTAPCTARQAAGATLA